MRLASSLVILALLIAGSVSISGGQAAPKSNVANLIDTYCSSCHNGTMRRREFLGAATASLQLGSIRTNMRSTPSTRA